MKRVSEEADERQNQTKTKDKYRPAMKKNRRSKVITQTCCINGKNFFLSNFANMSCEKINLKKKILTRHINHHYNQFNTLITGGRGTSSSSDLHTDESSYNHLKKIQIYWAQYKIQPPFAPVKKKAKTKLD